MTKDLGKLSMDLMDLGLGILVFFVAYDASLSSQAPYFAGHCLQI